MFSSARRRQTRPDPHGNTAFAALPNVTVPGPLNFVHALATVEPVGRPSSVTTPLSEAPAGKEIVAFVPAFTVGAWLVCTTGVI